MYVGHMLGVESEVGRMRFGEYLVINILPHSYTITTTLHFSYLERVTMTTEQPDTLRETVLM